MSRVALGTVSAFERVCRDAQDPSTRVAAEEALAGFRAADDAIAVALRVIEGSSEGAARFHAAAQLRTAALARWRTLPAGERYGPRALRAWAVRAAASSGPAAMAGFERRAVLGAAAAFFRRGFLDEPRASRDAFLDDLRAAAAGPDTTAAVAAAEMLDILVEQFVTPGRLPGVDGEIMARARPAFLRGDGPVVAAFAAAIAALRAAAAAVPPLPPRDVDARCRPSLALLARVLTLALTARGPAAPAAAEPGAAAADGPAPLLDLGLPGVLRLDKSWAPLVALVAHAADIALRLVEYARGLPDGCELQDAATQVVLGACTVSSSSFAAPEDAVQVLALVLGGAERQGWFRSPDHSERAVYLETWRQAASAHRLQGLIALGEGAFAAFARNCVAELRRSSEDLVAADAEEAVSIMENIDLLLETWASLAHDARDAAPQVRAVLRPFMREVFAEYLKLAVRSAVSEKLPAGVHHCGIAEELEDEDLGFDDSSAEESRKSAAAAIARFSWLESCSVLVNALEDRCKKAFFGHESSSSDADGVYVTLLQEDVYLLIELVAAVLADSCPGEVPSVPDAILQHTAPDASDEARACGHKLFSALIHASRAETQLIEQKSVHCLEASPRVGRAILDALERVTHTYLVPSEGAGAAFAVIGGAQFAEQARAYALTKALEALQLRFFDPEVADASAKLLQTLARGAKRFADVLGAGAWAQLLALDVAHYQRQTAETVEGVADALTTVLGDRVTERVVVPATASLMSVCAADPPAPDGAERCVVALALLRGVAGCAAAGPRALQALCAALAPGGPVASCGATFQPARYDVMRACLRLADALLAGRLALLPDADGARVLASARTLVAAHARSLRAHGAQIAADEAVLGVDEVLALLQHALDERPAPSLATHLFAALDALLPCMTGAFLDYPGTRRAFFEFVAGAVAAYPAALRAAPPPLFEQVAQSLRIELTSGDARPERRALAAVAALARDAGAPGVQAPAADAPVDAELLALLESILTCVALGSGFGENLGPASEALLPLMFCLGPRSQRRFEETGQRLMARAAHAADMAACLNALRERAAAASVWFGFGGRPPPQDKRPAVVMRRAATRQFREAVVEFSVRSRDVLLRVATQT